MKTENAKEYLENLDHVDGEMPIWDISKANRVAVYSETQVEWMLQQYADQENQQLKEENNKLVNTVGEWAALATERKHKIQQLKQANEELVKMAKQEKEADRKRIEELENKIIGFENLTAEHLGEMPEGFRKELRKYYKFNRKFTF